MKKHIQYLMCAFTGGLFLFGALQSHAANIQFLQNRYNMSQEQTGRAIQQAAWFKYNIGAAQERLGRHIQEGGQGMVISQTVLGNGIATSAHMRWSFMNTQESIGSAVLQVAQIARDDALLVQDAFSASQEALGAQISRNAQLDFAGSIVTNALYSVLDGQGSEPVSPEIMDIFRKYEAYNQLTNFKLGIQLLENENGQSFSHIIPDVVATADVTTGYSSREQGWGGFAEYGVFAVVGFIFSMWTFGWSSIHLKPPMETEEEEFEAYQKAA